MCSAPYIFRDALLALSPAAFGYLRVLRADRVRWRGLTPHSLLSLAACGGCSGGYPDGSHRTVSGGYSAGPSQSERVSSPLVSQKDNRDNLLHLDVRV